MGAKCGKNKQRTIQQLSCEQGFCSMEPPNANADSESPPQTLEPSRVNEISEWVTESSSLLAHHDPPLSVEYVEEILGYEFKEKRLLEEAFTHSSFDDNCYERLEHVGDSVLNLVITREFYFMYPEADPGSLTSLRATNVDSEKLARVAIKHGLHRCLRHKKPLLEEEIKEFTKEIEEHPLHSHGIVRVPKALADIVESTIGALFIDCNSIDTVWKVFKPLLEPIINKDMLRKHPKTELHEICQKRNLKLRFDNTWEDNGEFTVFIEDRLVGRGTNPSKKESAKNLAARNALHNFPKFFHDN